MFTVEDHGPGLVPNEVERLFRDHYKQQLPPQELAVLTRRIEGWAAGLQLFHLATRAGVLATGAATNDDVLTLVMTPFSFP